MKNLKLLLIEAAWLLGCVAIPYSIFFIILGNLGLDINLHDTYFVFDRQHLLIWVSTIFAFPLYFIKEIRHSFNRKIPFIIFVILGFSFVALIVKSSPFLSNNYSSANHGWTIYPPLSLQAKSTPDILPEEGFFSSLLTPINVLSAIQILIVALMLFAAYKFGKRKN